MITIFNRRELSVTYDMGRQAEIRRTLAESGIDYQVKVVNHSTVSLGGEMTRARTGSFGENPDFSYEYIIYVKKQDLERAKYLIQK
ncbi:MAG: hypothetical protein IJ049_00790 [Oscillospiraceae bacterium]|nr:hypothetical protein [Oscillospiraceae bacterium]